MMNDLLSIMSKGPFAEQELHLLFSDEDFFELGKYWASGLVEVKRGEEDSLWNITNLGIEYLEKKNGKL